MAGRLPSCATDHNRTPSTTTTQLSHARSVLARVRAQLREQAQQAHAHAHNTQKYTTLSMPAHHAGHTPFPFGSRSLAEYPQVIQVIGEH